MAKYWTSWSETMKNKLGGNVRKISIDAGFSCPNRDGTVGTGGCVFCNNEAFSPAVKFQQLGIEEQIKKGISYFSARKHGERYLAFFQAYSNTYAPVEKLEELYATALEVPGVSGLIVSTRPDCIDIQNAALLKALSKKSYVSVEIGVQSIYSESLEWMNRGHDYSAVKEAVALFADSGIDICLHVILGLPGEKREAAKATARELSLLNYHSLKLHNFHVLKNSAIEEEYRAGKLHIPSLNEHVELAADFLENTHDYIAIQRISGDAPGDFLVAPQWCLDKSAVKYALEEEFQRRKTFQGSGMLTLLTPFTLLKK
jgi:radical SAM protein (TIGR01212 family)